MDLCITTNKEQMIHTPPQKAKKISVDELRETHLIGPVSDPLDKIAQDLNEDQIVVAPKMPRVETITFRNQRDPGYPLTFHYHSKENPYKQYNLIDGHKYTLPVEIIKHLEGCRENIEKYRRNADGLPEIYVAGYKTHFVCERT